MYWSGILSENSGHISGQGGASSSAASQSPWTAARAASNSGSSCDRYSPRLSPADVGDPSLSSVMGESVAR